MIDFTMNLLGLILFLASYIALLVKHRCKIDRAAIIICSLYPMGTISQFVWRIYGKDMGDTLRSIVIIMHDLVVVSPSYFVYEMLKV